MIELRAGGLTLPEVVAVAREDAQVELMEDARDAMAESAAIVERLASSPEPTYGVSTGFGSLATTPIPADRREELQRALIRSHAGGMGEPVEREVVRAMMRAAGPVARHGLLGGEAGGRRDDPADPATPGSRPSSPSTARSAPAATSLRWRTAPWP